MYRIEEKEWKVFRPNVYAVFEERVNDSISRMGEFHEHVLRNVVNAHSEVFEVDTSQLFTDKFPEDGRSKLTEGSVDLIVTSPPYEDSHTTVVYGQFSRYPFVWLGYNIERTARLCEALFY